MASSGKFKTITLRVRDYDSLYVGSQCKGLNIYNGGDFFEDGKSDRVVLDEQNTFYVRAERDKWSERGWMVVCLIDAYHINSLVQKDIEEAREMYNL